PGLLPAVVRDRHDERVLDRTLERWRAEPAVPVLDLRPELLAAKGQGSLYYRNDSHWTPLGMYVGVARMLDGLSDVLPGPPAPPWTGVPHTLQRRNLADLWRMAGMQRSPPEEPVLVADRPDARARRTGEKVPAPDAERL